MAAKTNIGNKAERNQLNITIRSQPWYAEWFRSKGLDPNKVQLSKDQQKELQQLTVSKGFLDPTDGHIDPAGNVSDFHGWKGLPTAAKVAIIAGATVATAGAAGAFGGGGGVIGGTAGGSTAAATGAGATTAAAIPTLASTTIGTGLGIAPSIAGATTLAGGTTLVGGTAAAGGTSLMSRLANQGGRQLLSNAGRVVSQAGETAANNRGTQIDATLTHDQLQLDADKDRRAAETDAFRKSLYGQIASGYQPSQRPEGVPSRNPAEGFVTPQAREAGQMMTDTAMQRMRDQNYGKGITPLSDLPMHPGTLERIANYAGPAMQLFNPRLYGQ